jgi:hypothetical protein
MTTHLDTARSVARSLVALPMVRAVALGGSHGAAVVSTDAGSDIDVYAFTTADVPLEARRAVVEATGGAARADIGLAYWGPGDEWLTAGDGIEVDVVYFDTGWIEDQVLRVTERHEPSLGYSTCFWHTVAGAVPLEDPDGWFATLQSRAVVPYPDALRTAIVAFNRPVLRGIIPSYAGQLAKAAARGDLVSVNHRLAALLASYFDILFAVNRVTHPGEKRLIEACLARCTRLPESCAQDVSELLWTATVDLDGLPGRVDRLLDRLDAFLAIEEFEGPGARP